MGRHADRRARVAIPVVAGSTAAALVVAILSVQGQATAEAPRLSDNLVTNSTFEAGTGGWNTQSAKAELSSGSGRDSRRAALLTAVEADANLLLNDSPNIIQATSKGTRYVGSVWVRTDSAKLKVTFRFREVSGTTLVGRAQTDIVLAGGGWQKIEGEYVAADDGSQVAVQILAVGADKGRSLSVDDVDVRRVLGDGDTSSESPKPDPTPSDSPKPDPEPSETAKPTPTPTPTQTPTQGPKGDTLFGASVYTGDGTSFADALARSNAAYGGLEVVRVFHPTLPTAWPGKAGTTGGPVVVSFKANPRDVISGSLDSFFLDWFNKAPRDRDIFWSNYHEPEDQIETGAFTAAQYRDAFRHLDALADKAKNSHLKATTIWMCYDLKPGSGRDWRDYYPGSDVVDVMGWDCYNRGSDSGEYYTPAFILDDLRKVSESMGKPWGMAEFASKLAKGDSGAGRAAWLRDSAEYARAHGAAWVNYFDNFAGAVANPEYRLHDAPSRAAWRWAVSES